jgi:hypothetical protein
MKDHSNMPSMVREVVQNQRCSTSYSESQELLHVLPKNSSIQGRATRSTNRQASPSVHGGSYTQMQCCNHEHFRDMYLGPDISRKETPGLSRESSQTSQKPFPLCMWHQDGCRVTQGKDYPESNTDVVADV